MGWFLDVPRLADSNIGAITFDVNEQLQAALVDEGKAPGTVDRYMACWRRFLRKCSLEWGMMPMPPKVPMLNAERPEPRWLTPQEYHRLREKLPEHLQICADFAVHTGLRMRAQLSLKWSQVDFKNSRAWVARRSMKAGKTHGFPLAPQAVKALKAAARFQDLQEAEHRSRCARLKLPYVPHPKEFVFTWKGKPLDDCNTKAFQNAMAAAGIKGANWHTLRHTFASWAVQRGVSLHELMLLGPWESYDMVLSYAHLAQDNLAGAVAAVGKMGATGRRRASAGVQTEHSGKKRKKAEMS